MTISSSHIIFKLKTLVKQHFCVNRYKQRINNNYKNLSEGEIRTISLSTDSKKVQVQLESHRNIVHNYYHQTFNANQFKELNLHDIDERFCLSFMNSSLIVIINFILKHHYQKYKNDKYNTNLIINHHFHRNQFINVYIQMK